MTVSTSNHPSMSVLAAFALGKLDAPAAETIHDHLTGCADCRTVVETTPNDTLMGLLKKAAVMPGDTPSLGASMLTGTWSVQWGDDGENELTLGQWDVISIPTGIMRGFRNESAEEAYMLALVGGDDPGRVKWAGDVMQAVRDKGFDLDEQGKIVEVAR